MADIDAVMLGHEIGIGALLMIQIILAFVVGGLAYLSGRRGSSWGVRVSFFLAILLAVAACGGILYQCWEAHDSTRGRLEGRVPGPHLSVERAQNHLDFVWNRGLAGVSILTATVIGSGLLHRTARRRGPPSATMFA